ncbi:4-(cytidine 5'-diphospho)-2-C-methyl-D-erythritol kinase [Rudaeicoccus suwonensis]|uniref:4-diphosphocytidyl-2-C-methyl-D-erythritol kinase n=1 Tax=Rudaeicoccus suwonensis TaxID=657409 RepID=A0A561E857_9MICO|nr:4-(cytidine 5'-diphospho)-2-C-methyl-D-erythritol kinase [Rudaeicoccus suwonensis]TWE11799.1 4-diphosphocytidyl-2-C-methyl-D-erythritol kinase [Rudaeicoccus suwonensis]
MGSSLSSQVTVKVPAKVNLELRVGPLRDDGFHAISTVFHAVDLCDEVTVRSDRDWSCQTTGPFSDKVPNGDDNLAMTAVRLLARRAGIEEPLAVEIAKSIPVAGGMAGGSADAAGALLAADALLQTGFNKRELHSLASELGSDVPFALYGGTAIGSGRGEQLAPVLTKGSFEWVFALHHEGLSTPAVYAECDRLRGDDPVDEPVPGEGLMTALRAGDVDALARRLHNDLQDAACSLLPRLWDTLDAGIDAGALGAIVSGSGPTVAFLCADRSEALDLMVTLTAGKVADVVVSASGPVHGAHVIHDVRRR